MRLADYMVIKVKKFIIENSRKGAEEDEGEGEEGEQRRGGGRGGSGVLNSIFDQLPI